VERVEGYKKLSEKIGPLRMVWRYDPVMISSKYDLDFHRRAFEYLCRELASHSYKCMIGFIIDHRFIAARMAPMAVGRRSEADMRVVGELFGEIAARHGQRLETCATEVSLDGFGIAHGACVEREQIEKIVGYRFEKVRDNYLRPHCKCMESVEIGHYSTCGNGCRYCYATVDAPRLAIPADSPSLDPHFDASLPTADTKCRPLKPAQRELW
jgi:hypothetical protein